jgi:hypothetical protein
MIPFYNQDLTAGLAKNMFFLFKTKHTVFLILNSFFCLKHVLNLVLVKKNVLNQFYTRIKQH